MVGRLTMELEAAKKASTLLPVALSSAARLSRRTKKTDFQAGQSSQRGWSFITERV
jgi:hypothetical protein